MIFREVTSAHGNLPGIGDLLKRSWEIYRKRFVTLLSITLLSCMAVIITGAVFTGSFFLLFFPFPLISESVIKILGIIAGIACGIGVITGVLAFNFAIADEGLNTGHAFKKAFQNLFSGMWLIVLQGFIVTGGLLLFVLPGIVFLVWFLFSFFVFASSDDKKWWVKHCTDRGMDALLKSKEYVRGYWFAVFFRLLIIWIVLGGISLIPFIGLVLGFLFVPFAGIYHYLICQDLRNLKGDVYYSSSLLEKLKWIGAGTLGYTVIPALIIYFYY